MAASVALACTAYDVSREPLPAPRARAPSRPPPPPPLAGMAASVLLADTVYDVSCNVILDSAMRAISAWDVVTSMIKCWVFGTIISTGEGAGAAPGARAAACLGPEQGGALHGRGLGLWHHHLHGRDELQGLPPTCGTPVSAAALPTGCPRPSLAPHPWSPAPQCRARGGTRRRAAPRAWASPPPPRSSSPSSSSSSSTLRSGGSRCCWERLGRLGREWAGGCCACRRAPCGPEHAWPGRAPAQRAGNKRAHGASATAPLLLPILPPPLPCSFLFFQGQGDALKQCVS